MIFKVLIPIILFASVLADHSGESHEHETIHHPHGFEYGVKDENGEQFRKEERDGQGNVKGSYGYTDSDGTQRKVTYEADEDGFRANVETNEPGTASQDPADVQLRSSAWSHYHRGHGSHGHGHGHDHGHGHGHWHESDHGYGHGHHGHDHHGHHGHGHHGHGHHGHHVL